MPEASEWEGENLEEEEEDTQSETEVALYRTQTPEESTEEEMIQEEMEDEFQAGTLHLEDLEDIVAEVDMITQDLLAEFPEDVFAFELEEEEIDITIDEATDDVILEGVGDHFHQSVDDVIAGELADPELTEDLPEDIVILKLDEDQVDVLVYEDATTDSVNTTESQEPTQQLTLEVKEEQEELEKITESKSVVEVLESAGKPVLGAELEQEEAAAQDQYLEELEDVFARLLEEIKVDLEEEDLTIEISVEPTSEQQDQEEISLQSEKDSVQEKISDIASLTPQDSRTIDQVELGLTEYELFQLERQFFVERYTTEANLEETKEERIIYQDVTIDHEATNQESRMGSSTETETVGWDDVERELDNENLDDALIVVEGRPEALTDHSEDREYNFDDDIESRSSDFRERVMERTPQLLPQQINLDLLTSNLSSFDWDNNIGDQIIDTDLRINHSTLTSPAGLRLWQHCLEEIRASQFIDQVQSQNEKEALAQRDIEREQSLKIQEEHVDLQFQGPTLPEPPPYDFLAELEAWEEEEAHQTLISLVSPPPGHLKTTTSKTASKDRESKSSAKSNNQEEKLQIEKLDVKTTQARQKIHQKQIFPLSGTGYNPAKEAAWNLIGYLYMKHKKTFTHVMESHTKPLRKKIIKNSTEYVNRILHDDFYIWLYHRFGNNTPLANLFRPHPGLVTTRLGRKTGTFPRMAKLRLLRRKVIEKNLRTKIMKIRYDWVDIENAEEALVYNLMKRISGNSVRSRRDWRTKILSLREGGVVIPTTVDGITIFNRVGKYILPRTGIDPIPIRHIEIEGGILPTQIALNALDIKHIIKGTPGEIRATLRTTGGVRFTKRLKKLIRNSSSRVSIKGSTAIDKIIQKISRGTNIFNEDGGSQHLGLSDFFNELKRSNIAIFPDVIESKIKYYTISNISNDLSNKLYFEEDILGIVNSKERIIIVTKGESSLPNSTFVYQMLEMAVVKNEHRMLMWVERDGETASARLHYVVLEGQIEGFPPNELIKVRQISQVLAKVTAFMHRKGGVYAGEAVKSVTRQLRSHESKETLKYAKPVLKYLQQNLSPKLTGGEIVKKWYELIWGQETSPLLSRIEDPEPI